MALSKKEQSTLKQTRLRNLKRKYSKMIRDPALVEECIEMKVDIDSLERELKSL
ncbi:hypothetical protein [Methanobrevibacter sp.]|uniref:hypothetical protein n=1 Tax=Methanobrevibacter sp. TaxID=66852 RepID=UPI00388CFA49